MIVTYGLVKDIMSIAASIQEEWKDAEEKQNDVMLCAEIVSRYNKTKIQSKTKATPKYFTDMAKALRELWPAGEKDGKYPWRGSVSDIAESLEKLWYERSLKEYPLEVCLAAARRYVGRYEEDKKYMKILKYFIRKQKRVVDNTGLVHYETSSTLADLLENQEDVLAAEAEWMSLDNNNDFEQGELI